MALKDSFAQAERRVQDQNSAASQQEQLQKTAIETIEKNILHAYDAIAETLYKAICDKLAETLVANPGKRVTASGYITDIYNSLKIPNAVLPQAKYDELRIEIENSNEFFETLCKKHRLHRNHSDVPCIRLEHTTTSYNAGNSLFGWYRYHRMFLTHHGKEVLRRVQALAKKDGITVKAFVLQIRRKVDKHNSAKVLWTKYIPKHLGFKLKEPTYSSTSASHRLAFSYSYTGEYTAQN